MARISNAERGVSDAVYKGITSNPSYINTDPLRPLLSRCSFSAVAEVRGVPVY